jgi:hypothetical protein
MRTPITTLATVTAALLYAGSALAQPATAAPVRTESAFSPFVYEALGATPSIQLRKVTTAPAATKAAVEPTPPAAAGAQEKATTTAAKAIAAPAQAAAPATATTH